MPRIAALPTSQPASSRPARLAQSPATDRAPRKRPGFPEPLKSAKRTCNVRPQYSPCQDVATTASATSSVTARTNIAALTGGISHISTLSSLAPLRGDCSAARRARLPPGPVVTVRFARCERPARRLRGLPSEHRRYYRGSRRAWETLPRARETLPRARKSRQRPICPEQVASERSEESSAAFLRETGRG